MRVAIMQPYFYPYLGYFHLIASVDLFVLFDCVQFPRRGRVHRAPLPGKDAWLTLPLAKQPRDTVIADLEFPENMPASLQGKLDKLPWLAQAPGLRAALAPPCSGPVIDYLETNLAFACDALDIGTKIQRSSTYAVASDLRSQDRVMALASAAGATSYVNLPGGRALYDRETFSAAGLELAFMPAYTGPHQSMLHALATQPYPQLRRELAALPPATSG